MAPKSRKISWASDSESDISDYEYSYNKTVRKTSSGRDTFPRNKQSHMVQSRYGNQEERMLNDRANGRWNTMMNGRYMWFAAFMVFELVNVIVPWVVYFLILDTNNEPKAGRAAAQGKYVEAGGRILKTIYKHTRGQDDLWYYPMLAALMSGGALYIGLLLALMRSTRNVPVAIGVKVLQVVLCVSVAIYEMSSHGGGDDVWGVVDAIADMTGLDRGYRYGMPAYFSLTVVNMVIAAMLYFAFFWQSERDADDRYNAQQERRALLAEKGRYTANNGSDSEDEAEHVSEKIVKKKKSKSSPKKMAKEVYPDINSPQKVENYYYNTAPVPIQTQVYTVPAAAPQVTTYQIEVQPQPVEYTTTTTTIDVNTLPSRYENGQTIYTVDLN